MILSHVGQLRPGHKVIDPYSAISRSFWCGTDNGQGGQIQTKAHSVILGQVLEVAGLHANEVLRL
jgi:hypothetical protein